MNKGPVSIKRFTKTLNRNTAPNRPNPLFPAWINSERRFCAADFRLISGRLMLGITLSLLASPHVQKEAFCLFVTPTPPLG